MKGMVYQVHHGRGHGMEGMAQGLSNQGSTMVGVESTVELEC